METFSSPGWSNQERNNRCSLIFVVRIIRVAQEGREKEIKVCGFPSERMVVVNAGPASRPRHSFPQPQGVWAVESDN